MLNVGDRVKATRALGYGAIPAGTEGTVVEKYVPHWATGCWTITVRFEADWVPIQLPYPDGSVALVERREVETASYMGRIVAKA